MFNLGFQEILVILLVALIFLGPKMLPDVASGLGKAIREVRKAANEVRNQIELDDAIRKPLQELREATLLPPEELKRRDEEKAAQAKAQRDEEARKQAESAAHAKAEAPVEAPKAHVALRDATLVMNPPPDHNRPPFTPHPEALKPVSQPPAPVAPAPGDPVGSVATANDATVMDMAPVRITTPTPTVVAPMPDAQPVSASASSEAAAPRISASLPVVGLPPPPAARRPGVKVPPPLPLPPSFKKD